METVKSPSYAGVNVVIDSINTFSSTEFHELLIVKLKVNGENCRWIVKDAVQNSYFGAATYHDLYNKLVSQNLAPELVARSNQYECFSFMEGHTLNEGKNSTLECSQLAVQCIHNHLIFSRKLSQDYLSDFIIQLKPYLIHLISKANDDITINDQVLETLLDEINNRSANANLIVCHGDLNWGNILKSNKHIVAIDWEYFGTLPLEYEIAMTMSINQLDKQSQSTMLSQLTSIIEDDVCFDNSLFEVYLNFCHLINFLWVSVERAEGNESFLSYYFSKECGAPINNLLEVNEIKGL